MTTPQAFDRVLDTVGRAIVHGELRAGHVDTVEALVARTGASRSIVREAVRVLVALGLLRAGRRVGLSVLPASSWDALDPRVVRWRLEGPERDRALAELRALRRAVEPAAARAAATGPDDGLEALRTAATRLQAAAGHAGDATREVVASGAAEFAAADRALHAAVLALAGNAMFSRLGAVVDEALRDRADIAPDPHDVALHVALAEAIARGDGDAAAAAMTEIVARTA